MKKRIPWETGITIRDDCYCGLFNLKIYPSTNPIIPDLVQGLKDWVHAKYIHMECLPISESALHGDDIIVDTDDFAKALSDTTTAIEEYMAEYDACRWVMSFWDLCLMNQRHRVTLKVTHESERLLDLFEKKSKEFGVLGGVWSCDDPILSEIKLTIGEDIRRGRFLDNEEYIDNECLSDEDVVGAIMFYIADKLGYKYNPRLGFPIVHEFDIPRAHINVHNYAAEKDYDKVDQTMAFFKAMLRDTYEKEAWLVRSLAKVINLEVGRSDDVYGLEEREAITIAGQLAEQVKKALAPPKPFPVYITLNHKSACSCQMHLRLLVERTIKPDRIGPLMDTIMARLGKDFYIAGVSPEEMKQLSGPRLTLEVGPDKTIETNARNNARVAADVAKKLVDMAEQILLSGGYTSPAVTIPVDGLWYTFLFDWWTSIDSLRALVKHAELNNGYDMYDGPKEGPPCIRVSFDMKAQNLKTPSTGKLFAACRKAVKKWKMDSVQYLVREGVITTDEARKLYGAVRVES